MTIYAQFRTFNISFEEVLKKYFITSKTGGTVEIGGFDLPIDAINFAYNRVK